MSSDKATSMYQSLNSPPAGDYIFSFDYMNHNGSKDSSNIISWAIIAYDKDSKDDQLSYGNSFKTLDELQSTGTKLKSGSFSPKNTSLETLQNQQIAVPPNVERLVIAIAVSDVQSSQNDKIAVSKVKFGLTE